MIYKYPRDNITSMSLWGNLEKGVLYFQSEGRLGRYDTLLGRANSIELIKFDFCTGSRDIGAFGRTFFYYYGTSTR